MKNYNPNDNPTPKEIGQTFMSVLSNIEQEVGLDVTLNDIIADLHKQLKKTTDPKEKKELENSIKIAQILAKQQQIVDLEMDKAVKQTEKYAFGFDQDIDVLDQSEIENAKDELEAEAIAAEKKKRKRRKKKDQEQEFIDLPDELKDLELKDKKTKDGKDIGKAEPREKGGHHRDQRIR